MGVWRLSYDSKNTSKWQRLILDGPEVGTMRCTAKNVEATIYELIQSYSKKREDVDGDAALVRKTMGTKRN